jgi:hypothetical protein
MDCKKFLANEKIYDKLSIMRKGESPVQWGLRVKSTLQYLLSRNENSIYHSFCLFAGFGEGKFDESYHSYYRPKIHKNNMAICFCCWKPFQVNEIKPTKLYHHGWHRSIELIEAEDMMQGHWDQECSDPLSDLGRARVKQQAFDKSFFKNKFSQKETAFTLQIDRSKGPTPPNKLFISSRYAKQNNLLPPINHLNQPKGTV